MYSCRPRLSAAPPSLQSLVLFFLRPDGADILRLADGLTESEAERLLAFVGARSRLLETSSIARAVAVLLPESGLPEAELEDLLALLCAEPGAHPLPKEVIAYDRRP